MLRFISFFNYVSPCVSVSVLYVQLSAVAHRGQKRELDLQVIVSCLTLVKETSFHLLDQQELLADEPPLQPFHQGQGRLCTYEMRIGFLCFC